VARIAGIDIPREKRVEVAMTYIFGIGLPTSQKILAQANVNPDTRGRDLTEEQVNRLRDLVDRRYTDEGDLRREVALNIKRLTEIGSYRGLGMEEGLKYLAGPFDHAIATFLEDVRQRGLSEKILLVCCGEMGRTPKLNAKGGRDHWGNLAPLLIAGGGLSMGQVIGRSDAQAASPASEPFGIPHLIATILNTLFDVGELRLQPGVPREVLQAATAEEPIRGLA